VDEFYEAGAAYDFERLHATTKLAVRNLDNVIDKMRYIEPQMERSNMKRRPIGVGMMGFASLLQKMRLPWFDPSNPRQPHPLTRQLNARIAECMYHAQIEATVELAEERGQHPSFSETKSAAGMLQFDLALLRGDDPPRFYDDWEELRERMLVSGRRNDQLGAFMPTAATALVRSKSEGIDPLQSNAVEPAYSRQYGRQQRLGARHRAPSVGRKCVRHGVGDPAGRYYKAGVRQAALLRAGSVHEPPL
jgi:ribonucleotide reductase alpha subunit